jgi:hypothetical protein
MAGRYAFARESSTGLSLPGTETVETEGPGALLRRNLCRRRPGWNGCTMRVRATIAVVGAPGPSRFARVAERLKAQRRAQARPLKRRVRRSVLHGITG